MSVSLETVQPPPRLSDMYGEARLDALYRRAAADRDRFRRLQDEARSAGMFSRMIGLFRN